MDFKKDSDPLFKNKQLVESIHLFWICNMSSASMLRCVGQEGWELPANQLKRLC